MGELVDQGGFRSAGDDRRAVQFGEALTSVYQGPARDDPDRAAARARPRSTPRRPSLSIAKVLPTPAPRPGKSAAAPRGTPITIPQIPETY
ncbi:hypothetical protein Plo01_03650 [Planobispora longispora]|uniref:Uncharacterized protein n=1 Tax=Planobispora longispora TaxID=28887 RepID=A0A8J3W3L6_9ACTN|nr:hypothetical protein Plo01_03650 [Planobispora longispora]